MRSPRRLFPVLLLVLIPAVLPLAGCKQPLGGRCQTNSDCEEGECSSAAPRTCRPVGSGGNAIDAGTPDARIDAALDQPDAQGIVLPDASAIDAPIPDALVEDVPDADTADAP